MLKHYILTSLRNISRHRLFSAINILGLALGLASFLIIFLYVHDELKYDTFHEDPEQVYRIIQDNKQASGGSANLPGALEGKLRGNVPQAEAIASFFRQHNVVISHDDRQFTEDFVHFTDSAMFDILSIRLITGDPRQALDGPYKMVITPRMAKKYFGDESPIGKTLTTDHDQQYEITGILEPIPQHSHLDIQFLASLASVRQFNKAAYSHWGFAASYFYIKLLKGADPQETESIINDLYLEEYNENYGKHAGLKMQPLKKIYLHSADLDYDMAKHSNIKYVVGFSALAFFIILIAGFNYMNLSTARMSLREKEIGMRKIVGSSRHKITVQFLGESFVFTLVSAVLALLLARLALPGFNEISGKSLTMAAWNEPAVILAFLGIILFMTFFAGSYPALMLSRTQPLAIMKGTGSAFNMGQRSQAGWNLRFRQVLVFLQFAISVFLIIAAVVVYKQIHFIQNRNLGFNEEQVALVRNPYNSRMGSRYEAFAGQIQHFPEVRQVSSAFSAPPHKINNHTQLHPTGTKDQARPFGLISVNHHFFETIGATLVKGRDFSPDFSTDEGGAVILNETGARQFDQDGLLGQELSGFYDNKPKKVVGIVQDIHFLGAQKRMPPLAFFISKETYPPCYPEIVVKLEATDLMASVKKLRTAWEQVIPSWPFQLEFMDQRLDGLYRSEFKIRKVLTLFTFMAIFLSLLGLFGLAAFTVDRKMKEIGIRKAMGAGTRNIARLLSGEFSRWILVSNMVAWPAAYWLMRGWLNNYAYKTELSWWIFVAGTMAAILVTGAILSYHTLRAGRVNPAKILREE